MTAQLAPHSDPAAVLCTALFRTKEAMGLTQAELAAIIGIDRSSLPRIEKRGQLAPDSKTGELALLLIRVYRSLYALVGEDQENQRHWLRTNNQHLNGVPAALMASVQGLVRCLQYLDAMRGRV